MPIQQHRLPNGLNEITIKSRDEKVLLKQYFLDEFGRIHGLSRSFFENGRISEETNYIHGEKEGTSILFYNRPRSPIQKILRYKKGILNGECTEYSYNPDVIKLTNYSMGRKIHAPRIITRSFLQKNLDWHKTRIPVNCRQ